MDYTREDWERIGLLEDISEDRKDMVAHAMTVSFNWIDNQPKPEQDISGHQNETLPLLAAHRVAKSINLTDDEILEISKEVGSAYEKFLIDFDELTVYSYIDIECEFLSHYCDNKIEEYKNKNNLN